MSHPETTNGRPPEQDHSKLTTDAARPQQRRGGGKKNRPNYGAIHAKPLPLEVHPLPAFHPSHPLSLVHLTYVWLKQLWRSPQSHPSVTYIGYFSPDTRSVHVTDPAHARALWEMGFFGKGTLSRSEPTWLEREKAKVKARREGGGTAEEATNKRREERRLFKLKRAREEADKVERQRAVEAGWVNPWIDTKNADHVPIIENTPPPTPADSMFASIPEHNIEILPEADEVPTAPPSPKPQLRLVRTNTEPVIILPAHGNDEIAANAAIDTVSHYDDDLEELMIRNQEHLQLTLEEAFFLAYSLGVLNVHAPPSQNGPLRKPYSNQDLLRDCRRYSTFPPSAPMAFTPDDPFLLNYVVYHHFRSLGWVVRPGVKFSCDYLLYNRGPVFSHAEFAVLILPSYTHRFWATDEGPRRSKRLHEKKDWWWLHCVNRVQSQVKKTLVLCYVEIPQPVDDAVEDIGVFLKRYEVREFVVRRWLANRSRD